MFCDGFFWGTAHLIKKRTLFKKKGRSGRQLVLGDSEAVCFGMVSFGEQPHLIKKKGPY